MGAESCEIESWLREQATAALADAGAKPSPGHNQVETAGLRPYHAIVRRYALRMVYERVRGERADLTRDHLLAMDSGLATGPLEGLQGREPAFGLEATWIAPALKQRAETMNYTVVDAASVLATHLTELVKEHADELLSREEVNHLLEQLKSTSPKLVEETIPAVIKPGELQKVLQGLLKERVPVRDLATILETLGDWAPHTKDIAVLIEYARNALRRTICGQYVEIDDAGQPRLYCITMDPAAEDLINGYIERGPGGTTMSIPPQLANRIATAVSETAESLVSAGHQLIVLTSPSVRAQVKLILDTHIPGSVVLAYNEVVKGLDVESLGLVQLPSTAAVPAGAA